MQTDDRRWLEAYFERYQESIAEDNPLRRLGQLNFWVSSRAYNIVEMTHQIWLLAVCDLLVGNAEYSG